MFFFINLERRHATIRQPAATGGKLGGVSLVGRCDNVSRTRKAAFARVVPGRRCCRGFCWLPGATCAFSRVFGRRII